MIRILLVLSGMFVLPSISVLAQKRLYEIDKKESSITYTIVHPLHTFDAVSKSADGRLQFDTTSKEVTGVEAAVDVTSFDSGNSNRDSHAMEVVDALTYPDARFSSTSVVQSGDSITVTGSLLLHGVTKEIVMPGHLEWTSDRLHVQAHFAVSMTEFGIDRPSLLMMPVQDTIRFSINAVFDPR